MTRDLLVVIFFYSIFGLTIGAHWIVSHYGWGGLILVELGIVAVMFVWIFDPQEHNHID